MLDYILPVLRGEDVGVSESAKLLDLVQNLKDFEALNFSLRAIRIST